MFILMTIGITLATLEMIIVFMQTWQPGIKLIAECSYVIFHWITRRATENALRATLREHRNGDTIKIAQVAFATERFEAERRLQDFAARGELFQLHWIARILVLAPILVVQILICTTILLSGSGLDRYLGATMLTHSLLIAIAVMAFIVIGRGANPKLLFDGFQEVIEDSVREALEAET